MLNKIDSFVSSKFFRIAISFVALAWLNGFFTFVLTGITYVFSAFLQDTLSIQGHANGYEIDEKRTETVRDILKNPPLVTLIAMTVTGLIVGIILYIGKFIISQMM